MRVVSQNGMGDMPYDGTIFEVEEACIVAHTPALARPYVVATYTWSSKVVKAMEMLHKAYIDCNATPTMSSYHTASIAAYVRNRVFRFPADDEVEI